MTPAEDLAKKKACRRPPRNRASPRSVVWKCRLREFRKPLRLSIQDVAKAVGMSSSTLVHLEMGENTMLTTARRLADFFGKTVEEIWPSLEKSG